VEDVDEMTPELIAQTYQSALASAALIQEVAATGETEEESVDLLKRNHDYLAGIIDEDYWTNEDLSPIQAALSK
jgi:hypothetical protein